MHIRIHLGARSLLVSVRVLVPSYAVLTLARHAIQAHAFYDHRGIQVALSCA
jgi:hypothetical protein